MFKNATWTNDWQQVNPVLGLGCLLYDAALSIINLHVRVNEQSTLSSQKLALWTFRSKSTMSSTVSHLRTTATVMPQQKSQTNIDHINSLIRSWRSRTRYQTFERWRKGLQSHTVLFVLNVFCTRLKSGEKGAKPDGNCHYGRFDEQVPTICVDK